MVLMTFHPRNTTRRFRHRIRAGRPRGMRRHSIGSATTAAMAASLAVGCAAF